MELITIILSSLLGLVSPAGFVVDRIAEDAIRDRLAAAETLAVRIDDAPSYQLVQGKVDRVRIAGRGLYPIEGVRIDTLEVETDAVALDPDSLQNGRPELEKPLQAGIRLVVTQADLERALQSDAVTKVLRDLSFDVLGASAQQLERYDFVSPQVEFLENDRLRFQVTLQSRQGTDQIPITAETGINIVSGRRIQLTEPTVSIAERPIPPELVNLFVDGINAKLDLANLQESGVTARVLAWDANPEALSLALFVQVSPEFKLSGN